LLPDGDALGVRAGYPPEDLLDASDMDAARGAWKSADALRHEADSFRGAKWLFVSMRTGRGTIGVVGLQSDKAGALLSAEQRRLFDALADQAALAIERINLSHDIEKARL